MDQLIQDFGFRSIVNFKTQTWAGFIGSVFSRSESHNEFDIVEFHFTEDIVNDNNCDFEREDDIDDDSLTSVYYGRVLERTIFYFPKTNILKDQLIYIKKIINNFFAEKDRNKFTEPILVISEITDIKIKAYYTYTWKSD